MRPGSLVEFISDITPGKLNISHFIINWPKKDTPYTVREVSIARPDSTKCISLEELIVGKYYNAEIVIPIEWFKELDAPTIKEVVELVEGIDYEIIESKILETA